MIETRRLFLAALITAALGLGTAPLSALAGDDDDDDDDRRFGSRRHRRDDDDDDDDDNHGWIFPTPRQPPPLLGLQVWGRDSYCRGS